MGTEVATTKSKDLVQFEVADPEAMAMLADELDGIDGVTFERVKMPSGGGITFEIVDENGEPDAVKEIVGVIVDDHPTSALWLDKKENRPADEDDRPDAFSIDGKTQIVNDDRRHKFAERGLPMPNEEPNGLAACPFNQFGSVAMLGETGKGKATKNMWRLYIMREGAALPILVTLPPTSLKGFKNFKVHRIVGQNRRLCDVVVKLTLRKESGGGNDYSVVEFQVVGPLPEAQRDAMRAMRDSVRGMVRSVPITDSDYGTVEATDPDAGGTFEAATANDDEIPFG